MHHALAMCVVERERHLPCQSRRPQPEAGHRAVAGHAATRPARMASCTRAARPLPQNRAPARCAGAGAERSCGPRAGSARARAVRELRMQDLQGHRSVVPDVPSEIDRRHPAATEFALEQVAVGQGGLQSIEVVGHRHPPGYVPRFSGLARPTTTVMLSLPPRSRARSSRARHTCSEDSIAPSCRPISSSDTCRVKPSLQSSTTAPRRRISRRVTSGTASLPPIGSPARSRGVTSPPARAVGRRGRPGPAPSSGRG